MSVKVLSESEKQIKTKTFLIVLPAVSEAISTKSKTNSEKLNMKGTKNCQTIFFADTRTMCNSNCQGRSTSKIVFTVIRGVHQ